MNEIKPKHLAKAIVEHIKEEEKRAYKKGVEDACDELYSEFALDIKELKFPTSEVKRGVENVRRTLVKDE